MLGGVEAYARHRLAKGLPGTSLAAVQLAKRTGRIFSEPSGLLDFEKCDADWAENTRPQAPNSALRGAITKKANRLRRVSAANGVKMTQKEARAQTARQIQETRQQEISSALVDQKVDQAAQAQSKGLPTAYDESKLSGTYDVARTDTEIYKAAKLRLDYELKTGKLVSKEETERAWGSIVSTLRTRLLLLPDVLAPIMIAQTNILECRALIDQEIRQALTVLSQQSQSQQEQKSDVESDKSDEVA